MILTAAQLTPSGRPVLQRGEVEVSLLDKVDLEFQPVGGLTGQLAEAYKNGYAILTNRRLIWVDAGQARGADEVAIPAPAATAVGTVPGGCLRTASLPLAAVVACHKKVHYGLKGAKVRLVLEVYTDRQRQPMPASGFHTNIDLLGLRCRGPAPDAFKAHLDEQIRQAVAADAAPSVGQMPRVPGAPGVGTTSSVPAAAVIRASSGEQQLDVHLSPLRAGLQARLSPWPIEGSSATASAKPIGTQGAGAASPGPGWEQGVGAAAAAATVPSGQRTAAEARPDPMLLQQMVEMGFPRNRAARSLMATRNQGAQDAVDYLLAFGDQPGMDDPLDESPSGTAAAPQATAAAWGTALPSNPAFDAATAIAQYPSILPASGPPTSGTSSPYYPCLYSSQSAVPAALPPYGAALYGSGAAVAGPDAPSGIGVTAFSATLLQHQGPLRVYPHQYSSAPELAGSATGSPSVPASALAGMNASVDLTGRLARTIGVAGIVQREQQKTAESGRAVEQAFRDLSALMSSAAAMVELAEKFRGVLGADQGPGGAAAVTGPTCEDPLLLDLEAQQQLIALGISSPVTRETAGARYHIELSRQLADFLANPLQRVGGLMSLPDVYCLFNRARGTELVSPDDLLQAAKLFSRAGVQGLRLRQFSSGVLVIQGPQHSEELVCAKIAQLTTPPPPAQDAASPVAPESIDPTCPPARLAAAATPLLGPGVSASDVALALGGISVAIAAEHLLMVEARGVVCRDDGPEGLRFYRNFFRQDRLDPAALMGC